MSDCINLQKISSHRFERFQVFEQPCQRSGCCLEESLLPGAQSRWCSPPAGLDGPGGSSDPVAASVSLVFEYLMRPSFMREFMFNKISQVPGVRFEARDCEKFSSSQSTSPVGGAKRAVTDSSRSGTSEFASQLIESWSFTKRSLQTRKGSDDVPSTLPRAPSRPRKLSTQDLFTTGNYLCLLFFVASEQV